MESSGFPFCLFPARVDVPAIPIVLATDGSVELGPITRLPEGATLQFCGDGFNDVTVKIWWEGRYYFVFLEDLPDGRIRKLARRESMAVPDVSQMA